jgi:hypothetical protein
MLFEKNELMKSTNSIQAVTDNQGHQLCFNRQNRTRFPDLILKQLRLASLLRNAELLIRSIVEIIYNTETAGIK